MVEAGEMGLAPKACLLAQSRGGLMHYNWAAENPGRVGPVVGGAGPVVGVAIRMPPVARDVRHHVQGRRQADSPKPMASLRNSV